MLASTLKKNIHQFISFDVEDIETDIANTIENTIENDIQNNNEESYNTNSCNDNNSSNENNNDSSIIINKGENDIYNNNLNIDENNSEPISILINFGDIPNIYNKIHIDIDIDITNNDLLKINNNDNSYKKIYEVNIDNKLFNNHLLMKEPKNQYIHFISNSLYDSLCKFKKQIEINNDQWDNIKKFTNPYEFIHTIIPNYKTSVSKLKPLSRSFYKMIEIVKIFNLFEVNNSIDLNNNLESLLDASSSVINLSNINSKKILQPLTSFHIAEGPGGFIEAFTYLRKNQDDTYYGMTLVNEDPNCPGWRKSRNFLENNPNVKLIYGADNTGNLLSVDNLNYCINNYKNKIDIITADGGIDVSTDFNKQEKIVGSLIVAEVIYAIIMQKFGGHFVLKVFDIFSKATVDLIYLLSSLYAEVFIIKPNTSRSANSEKYVVCKNFLIEDSTEISESFKKEFNKICSPCFVKSILTINHDYYFISRIEEINAILGQQQIENIITTINTITNKHINDKIEVLKKNNIQKAIHWCEKYNIPFNKFNTSNNIFLNNQQSQGQQTQGQQTQCQQSQEQIQNEIQNENEINKNICHE